jgi:hypothetical protein
MVISNANPVDKEIHKLAVKSIIFKKAKFRLVIEVDTMITCTEVSRL